MPNISGDVEFTPNTRGFCQRVHVGLTQETLEVIDVQSSWISRVASIFGVNVNVPCLSLKSSRGRTHVYTECLDVFEKQEAHSRVRPTLLHLAFGAMLADFDITNGLQQIFADVAFGVACQQFFLTTMQHPVFSPSAHNGFLSFRKNYGFSTPEATGRVTAGMCAPYRSICSPRSKFCSAAPPGMLAR